ncbi:hypothetical protein BASA81_011556 [Batrachochytrium salamandrivorans]|nr:hypothetical protein BASA81_011556 [Batrachochytrium salamandrivorans]
MGSTSNSQSNWTSEQDALLAQGFEQYGRHWVHVKKFMGNAFKVSEIRSRAIVLGMLPEEHRSNSTSVSTAIAGTTSKSSGSALKDVIALSSNIEPSATSASTKPTVKPLAKPAPSTPTRQKSVSSVKKAAAMLDLCASTNVDVGVGNSLSSPSRKKAAIPGPSTPRMNVKQVVSDLQASLKSSESAKSVMLNTDTTAAAASTAPTTTTIAAPTTTTADTTTAAASTTAATPTDVAVASTPVSVISQPSRYTFVFSKTPEPTAINNDTITAPVVNSGSTTSTVSASIGSAQQTFTAPLTPSRRAAVRAKRVTKSKLSTSFVNAACDETIPSATVKDEYPNPFVKTPKAGLALHHLDQSSTASPSMQAALSRPTLSMFGEKSRSAINPKKAASLVLDSLTFTHDSLHFQPSSKTVATQPRAKVAQLVQKHQAAIEVQEPNRPLRRQTRRDSAGSLFTRSSVSTTADGASRYASLIASASAPTPLTADRPSLKLDTAPCAVGNSEKECKIQMPASPLRRSTRREHIESLASPVSATHPSSNSSLAACASPRPDTHTAAVVESVPIAPTPEYTRMTPVKAADVSDVQDNQSVNSSGLESIASETSEIDTDVSANMTSSPEVASVDPDTQHRQSDEDVSASSDVAESVIIPKTTVNRTPLTPGPQKGKRGETLDLSTLVKPNITMPITFDSSAPTPPAAREVVGKRKRPSGNDQKTPSRKASLLASSSTGEPASLAATPLSARVIKRKRIRLMPLEAASGDNDDYEDDHPIEGERKAVSFSEPTNMVFASSPSCSNTKTPSVLNMDSRVDLIANNDRNEYVDTTCNQEDTQYDSDMDSDGDDMDVTDDNWPMDHETWAIRAVKRFARALYLVK